MPGLLSKERIVAPPAFNRWLVPPASVAIHLCIGSVYAWSIFNPALIRVLGVVDAGRGRLVALRRACGSSRSRSCFSASPRRSPANGSRTSARGWSAPSRRRCWGGGYLIGGLGICLHQLWLLYLGYGVIGGCGLGLGLCLARQHADPLVPRSPRHGGRHGDHGLRRRRDHRRAAQELLDPSSSTRRRSTSARSSRSRS